MLWWIPYVMVRITLLFAAGIAVAIGFPRLFSDLFLWVSAGILCIFFAAAWKLPAHHPHRSGYAGAAGLAVIFLAGYACLRIDTLFLRPDHFSSRPDSIEFYTGVLGVPERKTNSIKIILTVERTCAGGVWRKASGKILLAIPVADPPPVQYSDRVMIKGTPERVTGALNPGEFDFRKYLRQKNIAHQHTVRTGQLIILDSQTDRGVLYYSQQARSWASSIIHRRVRGQRAQAITMALVLGVTEGLDSDLQDAYSASGATHVLSVSGLHVGIIYAIIVLLLKPLQSFSWSRWVIAGVSLFCLWAYAFITGLSPSVLRAVLMFSFAVAGGPFRRGTNISNTLAASAFLLLLMDPWLIESVGFQLSYLAVAGIVWLQKPLYECWTPTSYAAEKIWQVTAVSLAAQAATFLLGLFYFHQFPVYFLISNLLVIPLSTAVLIAGIVLLVLNPINVLADVVAWLVEFLVKLLNGSVFLIESLPGSVLNHIVMSAPQCIALMAMMVAMVCFLRRRKFSFFLAASSSALVFGILQWHHHVRDVEPDQMIVYALPGQSAFGRLHNGRAVLYADSAFLRDPRADRRHVEPSRVLAGICKDSLVCLTTPSSPMIILRWNGKTIVYWGNSGRTGSLHADYLIAGHNLRSLHALSGKIRFNTLILDGSIGRTQTDKFLREAAEMNIQVYAVRYRGAFTTLL